MATKTISLELDAYEYLLQQKRAGESFSAVVRRAAFPHTEDNPDSLVNDPAAGYRTARSRTSTGRRQHRQALPIAGWTKVAVSSFEEATRRQEMRNQAWTMGSIAPERGWTRDALYEEKGDSLELPH